MISEACQNKNTNGRRQSDIGVSGRIDLACQRIDRYALRCRNLAERVPKRRFQRHAGAVPFEGEGVFFRSRTH